MDIFTALVLASLTLVFLWLDNMWKRQSITWDVKQRGGQVISIRLAPFYAPGWFSKGVVYKVLYRDVAGNQHNAFCKVAPLTGLVWMEDWITEQASSAKTVHQPHSPDSLQAKLIQSRRMIRDLETENAELQAEIAELQDETSILQRENDRLRHRLAELESEDQDGEPPNWG